METIAFQTRGENNEQLVEKPVKLHPVIYDRFKSQVIEEEGFTMSNLLNEALAHFLGVGELSRSIELAEGQLEAQGVPLPPMGRSEVAQKNKIVADGTKTFNQVYSVPAHSEWKHIDKEDSTIYPNTNVEMWEMAKEYPGRVSYVVQAALVVWMDNPFDGLFDHLVSLQQVQASLAGNPPEYEEATEWIRRRMDGLRPISDGSHHKKWESLFKGEDVGMEWEEITPYDEVAVSEQAAVEAMRNDKLKQTGTNRVGVLCAVLRNKELPEDYGYWTREAINEINEVVNDDMGDASKESYLEGAFLNINPDAVSIETPNPPVDYVTEVSELSRNMVALGSEATDSITQALDVLSRPTSGFDLEPAKVKAVEEYTVDLIRKLPSDVWEVADGVFANRLLSDIEEYEANDEIKQEVSESTPLSV